MLAAAERIRDTTGGGLSPPVAPSFSRAKSRNGWPDMTAVDPGRRQCLRCGQCCAAILAVSGTVTLQIALVGTPLAIVYRMAPLTYAIGRRLVKVPHIGLATSSPVRGGREFFRRRQRWTISPRKLCESWQNRTMPANCGRFA